MKLLNTLKTLEIKLKIYRLQIFDYECQSDPLLEYHCKFCKTNKKILEEKAVDYWKKELNNDRELSECFKWRHYEKISIFSDDDTRYSNLEIIEVSDLADNHALIMSSE